jgi:5-methylcytosine-specific restriction endonuclease McrA
MSKIKKTKRELVIDKFKKRCAYCGLKLNEYNTTIDHIHPKKNGGTNHIENLFPACSHCNSHKSDKSIDEFREHIHQKFNSVFLCVKRRKKVVFYFEKLKKSYEKIF